MTLYVCVCVCPGWRKKKKFVRIGALAWFLGKVAWPIQLAADGIAPSTAIRRTRTMAREGINVKLGKRLPKGPLEKGERKRERE